MDPAGACFAELRSAWLPANPINCTITLLYYYILHILHIFHTPLIFYILHIFIFPLAAS